MNRKIIDLQINGEQHAVMIEAHWSLLQVLRDEIGLMGSKSNCLEAECGVCTVLVDGRAMNACILLAEQVRGRAITTIEGLGKPERLHPLQEAFIECGAVQCGYCIPGMLLNAKAFLDEQHTVPSRQAIREAISGTLCRCTGYSKIVDAIELAATRILQQSKDPTTSP